MRYVSLLTIIFAGACTLPPSMPPVAEFLVSAGDQTYWVRSDQSGLRVRGSPLILARTGGLYYELFVGEVDRSFAQALFSGERVFRRDLATGDSTMIYDDSSVVALATEYRRKHPGEPLLAPAEEPDDDVEIAAVGETDILNVLGPYVALEHRLSVQRPDDDGREDTTRAVIDLRNGKRVSFAHMLRDATAQESAGEGDIASRKWKHDGYEVVSHYDSTREGNVLALRDRRGREWKLGMVGSSYIQIFWLDNPPLDAHTRHALARAFDEATTYGGNIQLVSHQRSAPGDRAAAARPRAPRTDSHRAPRAI